MDLTGQVSIDATGKAADVLRRVQVRRGVGNFNGYPDYALETADELCKRLHVTGPAPASAGPITVVPDSAPAPTAGCTITP